MQGRLLPKYKGRYQAHPVGYWEDEFSVASELGLDCIEFILDYQDYEKNPLISTKGCQQINSITASSGVNVVSICADYFMEAPLHSNNDQQSITSIEVLINLLHTTKALNVKDIIIPCVEKSSLQKKQLQDRFCEVLQSVIPVAEKCNINLALETDLDPTQFESLLTVLDSYNVTVNYDIGNSAALGYNYSEELGAYGERISDIHIKDRKLGGGSVILGSGNADIFGFFEALSNFDYTGPFIMQVYRDDDGVAVFKDQLNWLRKSIFYT